MDLSALFTLSYGLYVVGTRSGDKLNGQISNAVFQVTADPVRIVLGINRTEFTHELISATGRCCVAVLDQSATLEFVGRFGFSSGRDTDKFDGIPYGTAPSGCPYPLDHVIAYVDLRITDSVDVGTHTLFLGEIEDCAITGSGTPMTYAYYREVLTGKTPPTAPSYVSEQAASGEKRAREGGVMQKYVCSVCGYTYDPEAGDPEGRIPPGTPFEDLPDNWVCPVCGVGKAQFDPA